MVREVDLVSYLPPYLQDYKEDVEALAAENPEFLLIWNAVDHILYNHFIETADSYGLSRFEKLLKIYPSSDDTLESRRSRIKIQWVNLLPYTMRTLLQKLSVLCGSKSYVLSHNFKVGYTLSIITYLENYGQTEQLNHLLQEILPLNLVIDSRNEILCVAHSNPKYGARIAAHAEIILTHDFKETWSVEKGPVMAGIVTETDRFEISSDFNENYTITGDARSASAVGYVDFAEIK